MSWRSAFLLQAQSDNRVRQILNDQRVEYAHQLHYLQMATEKLAKGFLTAETARTAPTFTHSAFVRCLQLLKGRREIQRRSHQPNFQYFVKFIDSILPFAEQVQRLAPSFAKDTQPNPEYPWQNTPASPVIAPVEFGFPQFDSRDPSMIKLLSLVDNLLRIVF